MDLLLDFLKTYLSRLLHLWPLIVLLTGLVVAIGLEAVSYAFRETHGVAPIGP